MIGQNATTESLDESQYATASILNYEAVYGRDYVSPGGEAVAIEFIEKMALQSGSHVLDVGCGLGGSGFVMARQYGLLVDGIDLSANMLALAEQKCRQYGLQDRVRLKHGDCLDLNKPEFYDGIYSRDVFLHINNKVQLFSVLKSTLKTKGKVLFTDYCCGTKPWGADFSAYVEDRGYTLHTVSAYSELIAAAGFSEVCGVDLTDRFIDILKQDLENIPDLEIEKPARKYLEHGWKEKLVRAQSGDHRWGLFTAVKH